MAVNNLNVINSCERQTIHASIHLLDHISPYLPLNLDLDSFLPLNLDVGWNVDVQVFFD